ncbi:MAG: hypothetical protein IT445_17130 [Phycisphaeraceae bacterium]|nr:hypothetical protein [Phycisphaeraceae bacterium]
MMPTTFPLMKFKPDFFETVARFDAWWHGEIIDRPPVTLTVTQTRPYYGPQRTYETLRECWFDVEYMVESAIARMECTDFVGDSFPIFQPNIEAEISATLLGHGLELGNHNTSAMISVVPQLKDWQPLIHSAADFDNPYWRSVERRIHLAIERCEGRFVVGIANWYGTYDILASLRGPQQLCMDFIDQPALVHQAGRRVAQIFRDAFVRSYSPLASAGFGSASWCPFYYDGPANTLSCDFWGMVSPEIAREFIWPEILLEMQPLERCMFHLDGEQALRHLDLLLECPQLDAIQWVYGDGYSRAVDWLDVYTRIRQAGKCVQIRAADAADALTVLHALGQHGLWIHVLKPFDSVAEAEAFVREVQK